jgi:protein N-terminal methyltransferase
MPKQQMDFFEGVEKLVKEKLGNIDGIDSQGNEYNSLIKLWKKVLNPKKKTGWYEKANAYWENVDNCPCTDGKIHFIYYIFYWLHSLSSWIDGVLGGYGRITPIDIDGSRAFLLHLQTKFGLQFNRIADCGAGIGRITKNLLLPLALQGQVDLVEQSQRLLAAAPAYIGVPPDCPQVNFILQGLQVLIPKFPSMFC